MQKENETIALRAHAKVNWVLGVTGRRADGYHELRAIIQPISLYDDVTVTAAADVRVFCDVPLTGINTAEKAVCAYMKRGGGGAHVTIRKRIPVEAGLGGGSADAAAVLRALDMLYGCVDEKGLYDAALETGADVPACLLGKPVLVGGIGEALTPVPAWPVHLVLAKPLRGVSTAKLFAALDGRCGDVDTAKALAALAAGDARALGSALGNALLPTAKTLNEDIAPLLEALSAGACGAGMSGAGSCCFAVYETAAAADAAARAIDAPFVYVGQAITDAWNQPDR